jgi:hypothetical protein|tara:strand:+ start:3663 stop:3875 length:213 start_codon:yes stop_codon:yes gene_type:complete
MKLGGQNMAKKILYRKAELTLFKDSIDEIYEEDGEIVGRKIRFNDFGKDEVLIKRIPKEQLKEMKKLLLE